MLVAEVILAIIGIYLTLGLLFAIPFVWKGAPAIDSAAKGTAISFRLLLIPGATLLWPILLQYWLQSRIDVEGRKVME